MIEEEEKTVPEPSGLDFWTKETLYGCSVTVLFLLLFPFKKKLLLHPLILLLHLRFINFSLQKTETETKTKNKTALCFFCAHFEWEREGEWELLL